MRNKNTSINQKAIASENKTLDNACTGYPAILLSGISANLMISLEKQLSWAVKTCCDRAKYDSSSDLKLKHNILPVTIFLDYKILCHFWKI